MLDAVLKQKSVAVKMSVKTTVAAVLVILAVGLPQIAHVAGGAVAGAKWLPMYAPVLLAGCLLGWRWGLAVGVLSPIISFGFTSLALEATMPALARLPYMTAELALFGFISGLFAGYMRKHPIAAFAAVVCAQIAGRSFYVVYNLIIGASLSQILNGLQTGLVGLCVQATLVPLISIAIAKAVVSDERKG